MIPGHRAERPTTRYGYSRPPPRLTRNRHRRLTVVPLRDNEPVITGQTRLVWDNGPPTCLFAVILKAEVAEKPDLANRVAGPDPAGRLRRGITLGSGMIN